MCAQSNHALDGVHTDPPGKYNGSIFVTAAMRPYATIAVAMS